MGRTGSWDDAVDTFARPSKHGSRPRTKTRPSHEDAERGMVTTVTRGRYTVLLGEPGQERSVIAVRARELHRTAIVCGDRVDLVGDTSGSPDALARIVRVAERTTVLRRTADDTDPYERIVVANADHMLIVVAAADPPPRTGLIDRCVVAAFDAGMGATLCLTKTDLADPGDLPEMYRSVGVPTIMTSRRTDGTIIGIDQVRAVLAGRVTVLVGHSGVGKSTLVNALVPGALRTTGHVNAVTGRGRQTSTTAIALRLPAPRPDPANAPESDPGWVIDTPGIRSFGLAHVDPNHVLAAFDDLAEVTADCPRGCTHLADSPDCALDAWVAQAPEDQRAARAARVASARRLLSARATSRDT